MNMRSSLKGGGLAHLSSRVTCSNLGEEKMKNNIKYGNKTLSI